MIFFNRNNFTSIENIISIHSCKRIEYKDIEYHADLWSHEYKRYIFHVIFIVYWYFLCSASNLVIFNGPLIWYCQVKEFLIIETQEPPVQHFLAHMKLFPRYSESSIYRTLTTLSEHEFLLEVTTIRSKWIDIPIDTTYHAGVPFEN